LAIAFGESCAIFLIADFKESQNPAIGIKDRRAQDCFYTEPFTDLGDSKGICRHVVSQVRFLMFNQPAGYTFSRLERSLPGDGHTILMVSMCDKSLGCVESRGSATAFSQGQRLFRQHA